jgi:Uma2 family endonuclease
MSVTTLVTAEELLRMPEDPPYELVAGELRRMTQPSPLHGAVAARLSRLLGNYADDHKLGEVIINDSGFLLARDPDTVLGPDVAFVSARSLAAQPLGKKYWRGGPDLAVEVVSPSNSAAEMREKAIAYFDAGSRLVWLVDPDSRTVTVYRSATDVVTLAEDAELDGRPVLPGFRCRIADLFPGNRPAPEK